MAPLALSKIISWQTISRATKRYDLNRNKSGYNHVNNPVLHKRCPMSLASLIMRSMMSRGLAAAVLAQMPLIYGIKDAEIYSNIAFIIIFLTVLFTTVFIRVFYKPEFETKEKKSKKRKV